MDALNISESEKLNIHKLVKATVSIMAEEGFETIEKFVSAKDEEEKKQMVIKYVGKAVEEFNVFAYKIKNNPEAERVFCERVYGMFNM